MSGAAALACAVTTWFRAVMLLVAALMLTACPPPPEDDRRRVAPPHETPTGVSTSPARGAAVPPPAPASAPGSDATAAPRRTDTTDPVVYEHLRGGVWTARCPSCGEVQAQGATSCPGCRQSLSPWRKEVVCTRCSGDGRCDHCGDERVCLACDGAGACTTCAGSGKTGDRAVPCPDCGGNGRCVTCRGDGVRDHAAGDFLADEGWLPGACPTCIDGSGLCPDCGSTGKNRTGAACATCAGRSACPECGGEGACTWCAGDGACTVCEGSGFEVWNGATRGPHERTRAIRTSAGSVIRGRVDAPPGAHGLRVARIEDGRALAPAVLPRSQVSPLSWFLVARDYAPGWDGRTVVQTEDLSKFRSDLADAAAAEGFWPLATRALRDVIASDPLRAGTARTRLQEIELRRVEAWLKRAEATQKPEDRDRAVALLEMVVFKGRGTPLATRAELQLLQIRKDRELADSKLDATAQGRRVSDANVSVERSLWRARRAIARSAKLLARAAGAGPDDASADRTFARAEHAAASARRVVQTEAVRNPPGAARWEFLPEALVTESRRASVSVLEAWTTRAAGGGRFDLAMRLARRGLALDPANENLKVLLGTAEAGIARNGLTQGSPPPTKR